MNAHRRAVLLAVLFAALATGACADEPEAPPKQATPVKAVDINPVPRDQLKDGGTVRWAVDQFSTQWNYNHLNGTEATTGKVIDTLMPGGFRSDERTRLSVDPNYVTSARVTSESPRQVVTYRLNSRARWSDGKPITWRDYEAQWRALRGTEEEYEISSSTGYERVASVERGRDEHEVVVTFAKRYGEWQGLFSPLYPAQTNSSPDTFNEGWLNEIPVTAGPFKLGEIDRTAKTITVVRDPEWWGDPAKLDSIVFRALEIDAAISAFANGEVGIVDVGPSSTNFKRVSGVRDGVVRQAGGPDFRHVTINGTSPLLEDVKVRRAIAMAINRGAIAKADLTGLNWTPRTQDNHFFVNTQQGYRNNAGAIGRFDPDRARELLDQAGWKLDGTLRKKAGRTLELRFVIPTGIQTSRQEGELIQAMLNDVGVKLDVRAVPSDDFFDRYVIPGNYDLTPFSWLGTPYPISSAASIYGLPRKDSKGELQIQQNFARVGSEEIDRLMTSAQEELDPAKARELLNKADKLIWEQVHSVTLYQRPEITALSRGLANVGSFGFKTPIYQDIGFVR
jgi:peptide/nickel transport system substrate-binding protein